MYAIRNAKSHKWLYGTDYRYNPPHQRTSEGRCMIFETYDDARLEMMLRRCGKDYEVIPVILEAVEETMNETD